ncbi:MAG: FHA domain-containing protein [Ktedonobacterales bacterium]
MRCSQGHDNPEGSAFCDECGERLDATSAPQVAVAAAPAAATTGAGTGAGTTPAKLVVIADSFAFELPNKTEVLIGREDPLSEIYPDVDLTDHGGEEGGVSRLHAKLYNNGGQFSIEDQNSTNSTFVNRQKLTAKSPAAIKDGDEIRLGKVAMRFERA